MSPAAGDLLVDYIAPRLRATIPRCVKKVGAEDDEELVQDAIVLAAKMLDAVERNGKTVTPGNVAYYTLLHMKSGRRSQNASRADVSAPGTQLDARSCLLSMEEEVGYDPELDEAVTLGDILAGNREDPSMAAARNVDWETFLSSHDYRYGVIVTGIMEGKQLSETARDCGSDYTGLRDLRGKLADDLRAFMGAAALMDSLRVPTWRASIMADRERTACGADRRNTARH